VRVNAYREALAAASVVAYRAGREHALAAASVVAYQAGREHALVAASVMAYRAGREHASGVAWSLGEMVACHAAFEVVPVVAFRMAYRVDPAAGVASVAAGPAPLPVASLAASRGVWVVPAAAFHGVSGVVVDTVALSFLVAYPVASAVAYPAAHMAGRAAACPAGQVAGMAAAYPAFQVAAYRMGQLVDPGTVYQRACLPYPDVAWDLVSEFETLLRVCPAYPFVSFEF